MKYHLRLMMLCLALAVLIGVVSGCAANAGRAGGLNSFLAGGCPAAAVSQVADDLAASLAEVYPPGHTSLYLKQIGGHNDTLGPAFDQALRSRGFVMATEPGSRALTVAYVLDRVDEATWYSRLSLSSGLIIARTYRQNGEALEMMAATRTEPAGGAHGPR